jgi:hypothetical protein
MKVVKHSMRLPAEVDYSQKQTKEARANAEPLSWMIGFMMRGTAAYDRLGSWLRENVLEASPARPTSIMPRHA